VHNSHSGLNSHRFRNDGRSSIGGGYLNTELADTKVAIIALANLIVPSAIVGFYPGTSFCIALSVSWAAFSTEVLQRHERSA
jgi:hypothetical protein